jgi:hypothetical protein
VTATRATPLSIYRGATFRHAMRLATRVLAFREVSAVALSSPIAITITAHGIIDGWPVRLRCADGLEQTEDDCGHAIDPCAWYRAKVLDANTITLAISGKCLTPYVSGGVVEFETPMDLTGATARMQIREDIDDAAFALELTTANSRIVIDTAAAKLTRFIAAGDTTALAIEDGVYDLELVQGSEITRIEQGKVKVFAEVTR